MLSVKKHRLHLDTLILFMLIATRYSFADLVRVTVVKLKAENRHAELGEGTLHSRLVKKLPARNLECYSRWLSVNNKDPAVTSLSDWLKEKVAIRENEVVGRSCRTSWIESNMADRASTSIK